MSGIKQRSAGFTLIEVLMVLAISSLLSVILFTTYSTTQRRARFTDAIERAVSELEKIKTEATSSFTTGPGNLDPDRIFFAKVVRFNAGDISVQPVTADKADTISGLTNSGSIDTFILPWGVELTSTNGNDIVVFARNPANGLLNTYVLNGASDPLQPSNYSVTTDNALSQLTFKSDDDQLHAQITVNAATGEISRTFTD